MSGRNIYISMLIALAMACASQESSHDQEKNIATNDSCLFSRYTLDKRLTFQKKGYATIQETNQEITYQYKIDSIRSQDYPSTLRQFLSSDSTIVFNNDTCKLTGSITLKLNSDQIVIKRYLLNDRYTFDDETNIFVIDNYGILEIKSLAWGQSMTFKRKKGFEEDALRLLESNIEFLIGMK